MERFANNAESTLDGGITDVATSLNVQTGHGARFPAISASDDDWFYVTLDDGAGTVEIVKCTARATDALTVERAQQGTTASAFSDGAGVELRFTAHSAAQIRQAIRATLSASGFWIGPLTTEYTLENTADGELHALPIWIPGQLQLNTFMVRVDTAGSGSVLRLGIYSSLENGLPGALVDEFGTVNSDFTGTLSITSLALDVIPGQYWLAALVEATTTGPRMWATNSGLPNLESGNFTNGASCGIRQTGVTTGSLPDPFPSVATSHLKVRLTRMQVQIA